MTKIERMAIAIMEWEGYSKGSVSYRNNNPGNIKSAGWAKAVGTDQGGHAVFESFNDGWDTLIVMLTRAASGKSKIYKPDMTFRRFFNIYAEQSVGYAEFVAARLGVSTGKRLEWLLT